MKALYTQITVDGSSGVGKGTLCKALAQEYNLKYLDSGTIYRAFALRLDYCGFNISEGYQPSDSELSILSFKSNWYQFCQSEQDPQEYMVLMDGDDVTSTLRSEVVGQMASIISSNQKIRDAANAFQRAFLTLEDDDDYIGVLLDGRQSGTEILPNADFKFFLECNLKEKARRRSIETGESPQKVYESLLERDKREKERQVQPLNPAEDAHIIDTSDLSTKDVFNRACAIINA